MNFSVPSLPLRTVYEDYRDNYKGGFGWRHTIDTKKIKYVAIHHTVTNPKNSLKAEVDDVYNIHVNGNKWGGIGYNFIISTEVDKDTGFARCAYVGNMDSARAHTPNKNGNLGIPKNRGNDYIIGIAIVGNFVEGRPSDAQLRTAHEIVKELIYNEDSRLPALKNWGHMKKHKDFDPTACCGTFDLGLIKNPPKDKPEPPVIEVDCEVKLTQLQNNYKKLESQKDSLEEDLEEAELQYAKAVDLLNHNSLTIDDLQEQVENLTSQNAELAVNQNKSKFNLGYFLTTQVKHLVNSGTANGTYTMIAQIVLDELALLETNGIVKVLVSVIIAGLTASIRKTEKKAK